MTGRVAVYSGPGRPLEIREYPVPDPEPGALLVRMRQANLCGSDLHFWRGHGPFPPERLVVLGHEGVGEVAALGEGLTADHLGQPLREGDRVVYAYFKPCRKCRLCLRGLGPCPRRGVHWLGCGADQAPHFHGTYGEYHYLTPGHWIFRVPDELPDEFVSPVNCALSEVIFALDRAHVRLGDVVLVQGAGGLGLYACAAARDMGAGRVIAFDRLAARLELAREFGADTVVNVAETTAEEREELIRAASGGLGADVALELVGAPAVIPEGIRLLRPGGTYLLIGSVGVGRTVEIEPAQIVRAGKTLIGLLGYDDWTIPRALDFLQRTRARYPFGKIVSHRFPFAEINAALRAADAGECIRATLLF